MGGSGTFKFLFNLLKQELFHALTAAAFSWHTNPHHYLDCAVRALGYPGTWTLSFHRTFTFKFQSNPMTITARKLDKTKEATALLRADHKAVSELFSAYENPRSPAKKMQLVSKICTELSVHAQVEEEIFYPAVKAALKDKVLIPEAVVEQATMKDLMAQVEGVTPDGELFDAKVKVLSEYVKHHVKEEHTEMFPKARKTGLDMLALGGQMAARKAELMAMRA